MTITEMRRVLRESGIRLTRSLGQNFLCDRNQIQRIADLARIAPGDRVLEIGPGLGPLTRELLARRARVLAIEKDRRLVAALEGLIPAGEALELRHGDALDYLRGPGRRDWSRWKLVANLPYSVGSSLVCELALMEHPPVLMAATLQREVGERMAAGAGSPGYGILSLIVQRAYRPGRSLRIPASCFFPRPDVESACLVLERRERPLAEHALKDAYLLLARTGFGQRRKILFGLLRARWDPGLLGESFRRLGIDPRCRAETLAPETFAALARMLPAPPGEGE